MIKRYRRAKLHRLWQDEHKFKSYLELELLCSKAWNELGVIPNDQYEKLQKASFHIKDIEMFEKETKHDIIAFIKAVSLSLGDEKKWFHYGLTSTDVVDSAQSLILRDVNDILVSDMKKLIKVLKEKALQYKNLKGIGRTHGIHAEPTSFGLKFLLWYNDLQRLLGQFLDVRKNIEIIKLSGAVGNFAANTPKLQQLISSYTGLEGVKISTQTLQRDRHARYVAHIALIGAQLEKMAVEIRHLARTEVMEVSEAFGQLQKGSSAMPHKKNPVSSENITGLSRVLRGYVTTAYENIALWHERDISHSSAERIILSDATILLDYMLNRFTNVLKELVVREDIVTSNIEKTYGSIYSQRLLNHLIEKGMSRLDAYDVVQQNAHIAIETKTHLKLLCLSDEILKQYVLPKDIHCIFNDDGFLQHIDEIYDNVL
jgi:adenylosuccinate lyase